METGTFTLEEAITSIDEYLTEKSKDKKEEYAKELVNAYKSKVDKENNAVHDQIDDMRKERKDELDAFRKEAKDASRRKTIRTVAKTIGVTAAIGGGLYYANARAKGKQSEAIKEVTSKILANQEEKENFRDFFKGEMEKFRESKHKEYVKKKKAVSAAKSTEARAAATDAFNKFKDEMRKEKDRRAKEYERKLKLFDNKINALNAEKERYMKNPHAAVTDSLRKDTRDLAQKLSGAVKGAKRAYKLKKKLNGRKSK